LGFIYGIYAAFLCLKTLGKQTRT